MSQRAEHAREFARHPVQERRAVHALDGLPVESALALERWLEALADLPLSLWMSVGRSCGGDDTGGQRRAHERIETMIADRQLDLTAWFIRDFVATASYATMTAASRTGRSRMRACAAAREQAEWAALAVAMETWLPCADHDAACAPFDSVIGRAALRLV